MDTLMWRQWRTNMKAKYKIEVEFSDEFDSDNSDLLEHAESIASDITLFLNDQWYKNVEVFVKSASLEKVKKPVVKK